jgi:hypothetical protein
MEIWRAVDAHNGGIESQNEAVEDCRPVLAESHNLNTEQDPDPDPHQGESRIRIRIKVRKGIRIKVIPIRNTCHNSAGAFVDVKVY